MPRRVGRPRIPTPAEIRRDGSSTRHRREILERAASAPQLAARAKDVIPLHVAKPSMFGPTSSASIPDTNTRVWVFTTERYAKRFRDSFKELLQ